MSDKTPPKERAAIRAWEKAHPDKMHESNRKWREKNLDAARAKSRAWIAANPGKAAIAVHRHRAKKIGSAGAHTLAEWIVLCWASGWRCFYCGRGPLSETVVPVDPRRAHRDHAVPLSRGGSNDISNIVLACSGCNAHKATKTALEFLSAMAEEEAAIEALRATEEDSNG